VAACYSEFPQLENIQKASTADFLIARFTGSFSGELILGGLNPVHMCLQLNTVHKALRGNCSGLARAMCGLGRMKRLGCLVGFLFLAAAPGRAQISPGPLSKAHESLSGSTQCSSCHKVGAGSAVLKCQECHTEIGEELAQNHGLHSRFTNKLDCAKCHSDHNGEDFPLIHWLPSLKGFDHTQTGYLLEGKTPGLDAASATRRRTFERLNVH
jgi:hypothetical protein